MTEVYTLIIIPVNVDKLLGGVNVEVYEMTNSPPELYSGLFSSNNSC